MSVSSTQLAAASRRPADLGKPKILTVLYFDDRILYF
jgi:hypothetical protein